MGHNGFDEIKGDESIHSIFKHSVIKNNNIRSEDEYKQILKYLNKIEISFKFKYLIRLLRKIKNFVNP